MLWVENAIRILTRLTTFELVLVAGILLLGGLLKGTVGFAVGLVAVAGLVQLFPPKVASVALTIPFLLSNVAVLLRDGVAWDFVRGQMSFSCNVGCGPVRRRGRTRSAPSTEPLSITGGVHRGFSDLSAIRDGNRTIRHLARRWTCCWYISRSARRSRECTGFTLSHSCLHKRRRRPGHLRNWCLRTLFDCARRAHHLSLANATLIGPAEVRLGILFTLPVFAGVMLSAHYRSSIDPLMFKRLILVLLAIIGLKLAADRLGVL